MPFMKDQAFTGEGQQFLGRYHSTFRSEGGQVVAHLFERQGWLVAYIYFAPGWDATTATDRYWSELTRYATEQGFAGKLKTILSD
ncbi:MAG TPA: hypothetical protein VNH11_32745 [Pirellulales bacterium]|nr:hypothetical protein [Pirellulales bacterium]